MAQPSVKKSDFKPIGVFLYDMLANEDVLQAELKLPSRPVLYTTVICDFVIKYQQGRYGFFAVRPEKAKNDTPKEISGKVWFIKSEADFRELEKYQSRLGTTLINCTPNYFRSETRPVVQDMELDVKTFIWTGDLDLPGLKEEEDYDHRFLGRRRRYHNSHLLWRNRNKSKIDQMEFWINGKPFSRNNTNHESSAQTASSADSASFSPDSELANTTPHVEQVSANDGSDANTRRSDTQPVTSQSSLAKPSKPVFFHEWLVHPKMIEAALGLLTPSTSLGEAFLDDGDYKPHLLNPILHPGWEGSLQGEVFQLRSEEQYQRLKKYINEECGVCYGETECRVMINNNYRTCRTFYMEWIPLE